MFTHLGITTLANVSPATSAVYHWTFAFLIVTDRRTDGHMTTAYTALAECRAVKSLLKRLAVDE